MTSLVVAVIGLALVVYSVTAGADFGAGIWHLFASGPRKEAQRNAVQGAIGPVWEANHVWMILVIVLLFVCFPTGFATVMTVLHIPMLFLLLGIILRGSAYVFRAYGIQEPSSMSRWGHVFAWSSLLTPVALGVIAGTVASGEINIAVDGIYSTNFVREWARPMPFAVGGFAVALFAYIAAVFLAADHATPADSEPVDRENAVPQTLVEDFRLRAILSQIPVAVMAIVVSVLARSQAFHVWHVLTGEPVAMALNAMAGVGAVVGLWALVGRRYTTARIAAIVQVSTIVGGWVLGHTHDMLPGELAWSDAAAPDNVLRTTLIILAVGCSVMIPALIYLFRVFKGPGVGPLEHG